MNSEKTALITGGASGIGLELAKLLAARNYNLILVGRNETNLDSAKNALDGLTQNIDCVVQDLSIQGAAQALFDKCQDNYQGIDILVNNAGVGIFGPHTSLSDNELENMLMLNITNLTLLCRLFGSQMSARKEESYILNVASLAGYQPVPKLAAYAASKSYVLSFSEALAKELENNGVFVTCLSPGHTQTSFFDEAGIEDNKGGFFSSTTRMDPKSVAKIGVNAMFKKKISVVAGIRNKLVAASNRFAPRAVVAQISNRLTSNP
ncbi:SDR family oxidoreductase [Pseudomonadales bacterium]|nr:SDR family oxidoreductase [Pseudomonadales bacterium]MDC1368290.1 SDR family oxidoreductase [Pseudomonadales bacterium]